jgi:hypothetical protein
MTNYDIYNLEEAFLHLSDRWMNFKFLEILVVSHVDDIVRDV